MIKLCWNSNLLLAISKVSMKMSFEVTRKVLLEKFYFEETSIQKFEEIAEVLKTVLTLSHAQASVELGFSHNNTVVQTNMTVE